MGDPAIAPILSRSGWDISRFFPLESLGYNLNNLFLGVYGDFRKLYKRSQKFPGLCRIMYSWDQVPRLSAGIGADWDHVQIMLSVTLCNAKRQFH